MKSTNPATGELIAEYTAYSKEQVEEIIEVNYFAGLKWRKTSFEERTKCLRAAAQVLRQRKNHYAGLMTQEMGKITSEAMAEVEKCAWVCDYYAEHAEEFLRPENIPTEMSQSFITYQPIGPVLAVMPWNFPFWQVFRFAAPALMAGNTALLKHASSVSACALAIEEVFTLAGVPRNCFRTLLIPSSEVESVIKNKRVRAVTLTGSVPAGRAVAKLAGEALKKTVLELGGSDAYLVLDDADLDLAAKKCAQSRLLNAGQSCIAAKRFLVQEAVYDEFLEKFRVEMAKPMMGPPSQSGVGLGPQASQTLRDELHKQVEDSLKLGAECVLGGSVPEGNGAFYPATILTKVSPGMPAYDEELFGPVASVIKVSSIEEAVGIANDSCFGLGGGVFTRNEELGLELATTELDTGFCAINDFVKSDPRLPFGGVKDSGYGRELSCLGIREFVNIKTVTLA